MHLIAEKRIKYNGKRLKPGDKFEMSNELAEKYIKDGKAAEDKEAFEKVTAKELKKIARVLNIEGFSGKKKAEIIDMIKEALKNVDEGE